MAQSEAVDDINSQHKSIKEVIELQADLSEVYEKKLTSLNGVKCHNNNIIVENVSSCLTNVWHNKDHLRPNLSLTESNRRGG